MSEASYVKEAYHFDSNCKYSTPPDFRESEQGCHRYHLHVIFALDHALQVGQSLIKEFDIDSTVLGNIIIKLERKNCFLTIKIGLRMI